MDELIDRIRHGADWLNTTRFLELLRWHRAVLGLPDLDWSRLGGYRQGVAELSEPRAQELLRDVRQASRDAHRHRYGAYGKPVYQVERTLKEQRRCRRA